MNRRSFIAGALAVPVVAALGAKAEAITVLAGDTFFNEAVRRFEPGQVLSRKMVVDIETTWPVPDRVNYCPRKYGDWTSLVTCWRDEGGQTVDVLTHWVHDEFTLTSVPRSHLTLASPQLAEYWQLGGFWR